MSPTSFFLVRSIASPNSILSKLSRIKRDIRLRGTLIWLWGRSLKLDPLQLINIRLIPAEKYIYFVRHSIYSCTTADKERVVGQKELELRDRNSVVLKLLRGDNPPSRLNHPRWKLSTITITIIIKPKPPPRDGDPDWGTGCPYRALRPPDTPVTGGR